MAEQCHSDSLYNYVSQGNVFPAHIYYTYEGACMLAKMATT